MKPTVDTVPAVWPPLRVDAELSGHAPLWQALDRLLLSPRAMRPPATPTASPAMPTPPTTYAAVWLEAAGGGGG